MWPFGHPDPFKLERRKDVRGLLKALRCKDAVIRRNAAQAVGRLGDARAVPALISGLGDVSDEVRSSCAASLGRLRDARAISPLIECLERNEWALDQDVLEEAFYKLGDRAIEPLVRALTRGDSQWKKRILHLISKTIGKTHNRAATLALCEMLGDSAWPVRIAACRALGELEVGELGDDSAMEQLCRTLSQDDASAVRAEAARALVTGGTRAVLALIKSLRDKEHVVRKSAAEVLGMMHARDAVDSLCETLRDPVTEVRTASIHALRRISDRRALGPIQQALQNEKDEMVRREISSALVMIAAKTR